MNANVELLNYIYQNAEMGKDTIKKLIEVVKDSNNEEFNNFLKSQFNEYKEIFMEAENLLNSLEKEGKSINKLQKIEANMMINMKTINGKSPDHISEMLMQGSIMGVIQIIRRMKQYKNQVSKNVYSLAQKLLDTEQRNLEDCKKFLGAQNDKVLP